MARAFNRTDGDVTGALQACLGEGPGVVLLGPGTYVCSGLRIPGNVTLAGEGAATVLKLGKGSTLVEQDSACGWGLRDLVVEGSASGDWKNRTDAGQAGIAVGKCWGYEILGVVVRHFDGSGVRIRHTALAPDKAPYCNGGNLDRITIHDCHTGLCFGERGEYLNAVGISAYQNVTGVVIHAGNVKLAASNICSNLDGVFIEDQENGSHGALANCLVNHNGRHALWCRNVKNGMTIQNTCFFYGDIAIEESQGVVISGGEICCNMLVRGGGLNRIAGNYVIPYTGICEKFDLSPSTMLDGNFTAVEKWPSGRG